MIVQTSGENSQSSIFSPFYAIRYDREKIIHRTARTAPDLHFDFSQIIRKNIQYNTRDIVLSSFLPLRIISSDG